MKYFDISDRECGKPFYIGMVCSLAAVALQVELKHEIAVFYQVTF